MTGGIASKEKMLNATETSLPALIAELHEARAQTDTLFSLLSPDALYTRPIPERHRLIFYLGHFDAFDWNILARRGLSAPSFHPAFDGLFERGIDPAPGEAAADSPQDWPREAEIREYTSRTRVWIDEHLQEFDPWVLRMAIEHRHMHAETFAYLLHSVPYAHKRGPADRYETSCPAPANPMLDIDPGIALLGQMQPQFGWDNEFRAHPVFVPAFRISKFKVSNGEYLDFVRAGGSAPHFWACHNGQWFYRGMFSQFPLPLDWPVWVTWQQAFSYAVWRGLRLPTEAQFHRAASLNRPHPLRDNYGYRRWDPVPVDHRSDPESNVPSQMTGNGWEWTGDLFAPFDGFAPHPLYPGYSADFFDGAHFVMKGASPRTAALFTRPSFRNWFRSDYPYMYAAFRLVES